jgi:penicillin V acylase-like amidase (Ntn superfamily)
MLPRATVILSATVWCLAVSSCLVPEQAAACSRVFYVSPSGEAITGRSMEWFEDQHPNLWTFPRGIEHYGATKQNPLVWTSKYGSVATSAYDIGTADGINEKGLVVNMLFLDGSDYGARDPARPGLALSLWAQYYLDNFATVAEAVQASRSEPFQPVTMEIGKTRKLTGRMHLSLADATGDSAVLEYLHGKLVIHHGREFKVMTNEPSYDEQLALLKRYKLMGGDQPLPNGITDDDRFLRATYYLDRVPSPADEREAIAFVMSISRNLSVPYTVNASSDVNWRGNFATIFRTIADSTDRLYFFESTLSPNVIWVDLSKLDFATGEPVKELPVSDNKIRVGDVTAEFVAAKPFTFLPE